MKSSLRYRWLAPEVVQTSAMDCGPASLTCLLQGFGIPASYGRLREACQTDVDGTSIDALEEAAVQLGLNAEQIMLPADHLLVPAAQALPALIIVRLPNGYTHAAVAWRMHGPFVQVMDPAKGRRWLTRRQFLADLYIHQTSVPAAAWREWAASDEFLAVLRQRMAALGVAMQDAGALIQAGLADPGWGTLAALDAVVRMVAALVQAGGFARGLRPAGALATRTLQALFDQARRLPPGSTEIIPEAYWSVRPEPGDDAQEENLFLRGAVLVRVQGALVPVAEEAGAGDAGEAANVPSSVHARSLEMNAVLQEPAPQPGRELWRFLRSDGLLAPLSLVGAIGLASVGVVIEALLLRGLLSAGTQLPTVWQRAGAMAALLAFVLITLLLQLGIELDALRLGRRLEMRLRMAFLEKIPRIGDRYFHSRPVSDMAERGHSLHQVRQLAPDPGRWFLTSLFEVALTTAGMIWIYPPLALVTLLAALAAVLVPFLAQPLMTEQDLRVRTHLGALGRYVLDVLLGLVAVRAHRAERAIRREQENLLREWARAQIGQLQVSILTEGLQIAVVLAGVIWVMLGYVTSSGDHSGALLLAYWGLNLPYRGRQMVYALQRYATLRNISMRMFEPLGAPEDNSLPPGGLLPAAGRALPGVGVRFEGVSVHAAGHMILQDIDLTIEPGSHVAIVGPSGAGKTSLFGLLLGWHHPAAGAVRIDGEPIDVQRLRQEIAWVDPAVQLWNRSFLENLCYGNWGDDLPLAEVIAQADLHQLLETLPDGLQTTLGEGGGLVSGGEGQRVRLGRAMLRRSARLVLLDEPFRGLGGEQRRELLARARKLWAGATLLCITHDVSETQTFERVVVIENGQIAADGAPAELAARPGRYADLLAAETRVHAGLWGQPFWRRLWMEKGRLALTPYPSPKGGGELLPSPLGGGAGGEGSDGP